MRMHTLLAAGLVTWILIFGVQAQTTPLRETACTVCHSNADLWGEESAAIVQAFQNDVHAGIGLSCHDCHGGNPDLSLAEDLEASMDENYRPNPFVGSPARTNVPGYCGKCHSDPNYMKRFKPDARVDQESEYWTSQHGRSLRQGDEKVATCIDCHGVHGILEASNPRSKVYPTNVALTCRECHEDAERMKDYVGPHGQPLRVDQYARWRQSVHAQSMFDREDLSAPTCNDCHGNHGAAPPGLEDIAFVCGQCHGRESTLFRASPKKEALDLHSEFLADAGADGCKACHDDKPRGELPFVNSFGECSSCHGNHGIVRPSTAMFSPLPETPCAFCHEAPVEFREEFPELSRVQESYEQMKAALLQESSEQGVPAEELYDWMVDQALALPTHTLGGVGEDGTPQLRPEFQELFQKFRIGKTFYVYADPVSGELAKGHLVRCTSCHEDGSAGAQMGRDFVARIQELTALASAAERNLLSARRAGMETREALADIKSAVDAQISLAVLTHTFALDKGFLEKQKEGLEHTMAALTAGREAHQELQTRRFGLAVALVVILIFLVALGFKIREVSARESASAE